MKLMDSFQKIAPAVIRYFAEKLNFVFLLAQPPMSSVLRALASPKGLKGENPRPSAAVRRILGRAKTYKGGRTKFDFSAKYRIIAGAFFFTKLLISCF